MPHPLTCSAPSPLTRRPETNRRRGWNDPRCPCARVCPPAQPRSNAAARFVTNTTTTTSRSQFGAEQLFRPSAGKSAEGPDSCWLHNGHQLAPARTPIGELPERTAGITSHRFCHESHYLLICVLVGTRKSIFGLDFRKDKASRVIETNVHMTDALPSLSLPHSLSPPSPHRPRQHTARRPAATSTLCADESTRREHYITADRCQAISTFPPTKQQSRLRLDRARSIRVKCTIPPLSIPERLLANLNLLLHALELRG